MTMKTVSLVLGSGGARGLAHIGVINWLHAHHYHIRSISGCSMGALVGGIYAAGRLDEYTEWVASISKLDILTLLDLSLSKGGLVKGDRIINTLKELVGEWRIEDLAISFTAVATDIVHGKEIWIKRGSLFDAIRASISLPLFFTPVTRAGVLLVDGGILNPVPIAPTFGDETEMTIAVNLGGDIDAAYEHEAQHAPQAVKSGKYEEKVRQFIADINPSKAISNKLDLDMYNVANQSFDAMQSAISRQKLAAYPPDITIEIARNACGTLEFDRADEMIALGLRKTEEQMGKLPNV